MTSYPSNKYEHLLDRAESVIQYVVQIATDVRRREAESNISLILHKKSNVRRCTLIQMPYYAESVV